MGPERDNERPPWAGDASVLLLSLSRSRERTVSSRPYRRLLHTGLLFTFADNRKAHVGMLPYTRASRRQDWSRLSRQLKQKEDIFSMSDDLQLYVC